MKSLLMDPKLNFSQLSGEQLKQLVKSEEKPLLTYVTSCVNVSLFPMSDA